MSAPLQRIAVESVTHEWRGAAGPHRALDDVSLEVHAGEVVTIEGRSGAGKTTLLCVLGGLTRPSDGRVFIGSSFLWGLADAERTALRRGAVAFVLQRAEMISSLRVADNIALAALATGAGPRAAYERAGEQLERVGLSHRESALACELSGGEVRRAALARALASEAPFLLADEPTGDLDPQTATQVRDVLLDRAAAGCGIVIVTHDPALAGAGSRRLTLEEGRLADAR